MQIGDLWMLTCLRKQPHAGKKTGELLAIIHAHTDSLFMHL